MLVVLAVRSAFEWCVNRAVPIPSVSWLVRPVPRTGAGLF